MYGDYYIKERKQNVTAYDVIHAAGFTIIHALDKIVKSANYMFHFV